MKNIHLLPTDKPNRLYKNLLTDKFFILENSFMDVSECNREYQNIYITSDEEIKEGDWIYGLFNGGVVIKSEFDVPKNSQYYKEYGLKIILTTDQDLIKEGVQAIDDEFLEWFVKNPSCEEVETERFYTMSQSTYSGIEYEIIYSKKNFYCGDEVDYGEQCDFQCDRCVDATGVDYGYLPKEEPKQGTMSESIKQVISNQLKQETLEDIELEEVRGSIHCQFSVVENKLAIIYRNQLKILQAIKMLNNER
jgi:hypothetical protein